MKRPTKDSSRPYDPVAAAWVVATVMAMLLFSVVLAISFVHGGVGIGIEDGSYIGRQGKVRLVPNQIVGAFWWYAQVLFLLAVPVVLVLTLLVFFRTGSLRVADLFPNARHKQFFERLLWLGQSSMALCCLVGIIVLFRQVT